MKWLTPTTEEQAIKIIDEAEELLNTSIDGDIIEYVGKQLALYAACFNHNFSKELRKRIMDLLILHKEKVLYSVLEVLAEITRVEQIDFTYSYIINIIQKGK